MQFTAKQISDFLNGAIEGDETATVSELSKIEDGKKGALCFLSNRKYENYIYSTQASVVIVGTDFMPAQPVSCTLVRVKDPYSAFSVLLEKYNEVQQADQQSGIEQPSFIHPSARLGKNVSVGAFSYISANVEIGDNSRIHPQVFIGPDTTIGAGCTFFPGVKIYNRSVIGEGVIIHSNTVIGSDGFGFAPQPDGSYSKIPQIGNVVIENNVEIGANTAVDRATMGSTFIRQGVKLDNLIQIGHNVEISQHTVVAAQAGISGSTKVGERAIIGGQAGVAGHLTLAAGTQLGAQAGVNSSITEGNKQWHGTPAQPFRDWMRASVLFRQLPQIEKRISKLEAECSAKLES